MKQTGIILIFIAASNWLFAQDHMIQGIVHTLDRIPLIGAGIEVKSTGQSVYTDSLGKFIAFCEPKDKLKISAGGFYNQNVKVSENTKLVAVNLKMKPGEKEQEYAIGYGYVSEENRTNAISGVNTTDDYSFTKYTNIYDMIRGQLAGVQVTNGEIIIRGTNSFQGSSAALIVVDGIIVDGEYLNTLSPMEVKRIDVIKDGGSAVYGSRGANGVVLIETRKGGDEVK